MASLERIVTALIVLMLVLPAGAQEPAANGTAQGPALDADAFRLPSAAYDTSRPKTAPAARPAAEGFNPGRFDLGDSVLQFDTKRQVPDTRVGSEAIDPKRLGGISKDDTSSPLPNYFGMTLSKPLN